MMRADRCSTCHSRREIMNESNRAPSVRVIIERIFTGVAAVVIVAFVAVGTVAMCLPGAGVA
jgi:hypothetical protein